MVVGCPVLIAKVAVPVREDTEAIRSRLACLPGRSQDHNGIDHTDTRGNADCYVSRKQRVSLTYTYLAHLNMWASMCVTYLFACAKCTYFITCICCSNADNFCL